MISLKTLLFEHIFGFFNFIIITNSKTNKFLKNTKHMTIKLHFIEYFAIICSKLGKA